MRTITLLGGMVHSRHGAQMVQSEPGTPWGAESKGMGWLEGTLPGQIWDNLRISVSNDANAKGYR